MADKPLPDPVQKFVDTIRTYCADGKEGETLWPVVAEDLKALLSDPTLIEQSKTWPDTKKGDGPPSNLLFYEDPDYGFVLNALVKGPKSVTNVHDHGPSWTLYGVLDGGEHIERFSRIDDNPTEEGPAELTSNVICLTWSPVISMLYRRGKFIRKPMVTIVQSGSLSAANDPGLSNNIATTQRMGASRPITVRHKFRST